MLWSASQRLDLAARPPPPPRPPAAASSTWRNDTTHNVLVQLVGYTPADNSAHNSPSGPADADAPPTVSTPSAVRFSLEFYHFGLRTTPLARLVADGPADGGAAQLPSSDGEMLLMPADPELAREGPGLVERYLLAPPAERHADWDAQAPPPLCPASRSP